MKTIERINYKNPVKEAHDFEIVDLQLFFSTRPHWHISRDYRLNFWLLMYIYEGEGYHVVDFEQYRYKAGDMILIQRNQVQHYVVNDHVKGYIVFINEPFFLEGEGLYSTSFLEFFDRPFKSPIITIDSSIPSTNRTILDLIYKEYLKSSNSSDENLIRSLFQSFIFAIQNETNDEYELHESKVFNHYNTFRKLVETHFDKIKSVAEYAQMMNTSPKVINYATRHVVGLSAKQFIIERIRLEIKRYLSQGELMNYEIADLLGFDEPANMTKFFKRYEGVSPKAFRKSILGNETMVRQKGTEMLIEVQDRMHFGSPST